MSTESDLAAVVARFPHASRSFIERNLAQAKSANSTPISHLIAQNGLDRAQEATNGIRQDRSGPNKLELALEEHLRSLYPQARVELHALTLRLSNGCRYTPDVVVVETLNAAGSKRPLYAISCWEAKGTWKNGKPGWQEDAKIKVKLAPRCFPWIDFYVASRRGRACPWLITKILQ
jgi:hypothetical protein